MTPLQKLDDSDSEDDPDFVPTADPDSESGSDDGNRPNKKRKVVQEEVTTEKDIQAVKKERQSLWAEFQADILAKDASGSGSSSSAHAQPAPTMVMIERKYRFAGEDVIEVVQVPEDSEDAKKWPRVDASQVANSSTSLPSTTPTTPTTPATPPTNTPPRLPSTSSTSSHLKRPPGPRKPKQQLLGSNPPKPKKLSTFAKSAMDWNSHLASDQKVKEDLESHRRDGGYLEKVDFLDRVGQRKEAERERLESNKRRRT